MSTETNSTATKTSWVKQAYFYIVMIGCIIAISAATIVLFQKVLTRYAFPKAENQSYLQYGYGSDNNMICQSELMSPFYMNVKQLVPGEVPATPPAPSQDKIDKCIADKKQLEIDRREGEFQYTVLNTILTIIVASIVAFVHIKYVKPKI
jgi:hypothetical protein